MSDNIRIKTTPGGGEKLVNLQINQKFDFIEILSLKISQDETYRRFCSDYGVVVGRVIINNGVGVPNAKVSIFIPVDEVDAEDSEVLGMYPYKEITTKDSNGIPYNLVSRNNRGKDECFTPIGTFPSKREIQDNPILSEVYCKYYKFTCTTNESGDFMFFGIPIGTHFMHVNADISDIGILSQRPYDQIREGDSERSFTSSTKFKGRKESSILKQLKTSSPISVNVPPFWGDTEQCGIGIARSDVDLSTDITPSAIFMGAIISDNDKHALSRGCRPRKKLGKMEEIVTGDGRIEMIRKTFDGGIERFDIEGGQVIDEDGAWAYQIPMNRGYMVTSEDGTLVPSGDPTKGIATSARVRFRIGMMIDGDEGRLRTRAKYLVPHNPPNYSKVDFSFDTSTSDDSFTDLSWNNIYTVKNHISRVQPTKGIENRNFIGLKNVDDAGTRNPFPFNKLDNDTNPLFIILCILISIIARLVGTINRILIPLLNIVMKLVNRALQVICNILKAINYVVCGVKHLASKSKRKSCRNDRGKCMKSDCSCNDILPYIPYILLKCDGGNGDWSYAAGVTKNEFPPDSEGFSKQFLNGYNATIKDTSKTYVFPNQKPKLETNECTKDQKKTVEGCDGGWTYCQALRLADALDVFKFDFYNDWINGTLYTFLLKYKKKRSNGDEKFCELECDDFSSTSPNKCRTNYIVDSCTGALPQDKDYNGNENGVDSKQWIRTRSGYIKNNDGELYYSPITYKNNNKLFATDIVNLGSIFDCSWNGDLKFYQYLTDSTFEIPPLVSDLDENDPSIVLTTGFKLFGDISCFGFATNSRNCNNLKRVCELSVGLDEFRGTSSLADNLINNKDVEDPFVRGIFSKLNSTLLPTLDEIYIDSPTVVPAIFNFNYEDNYYTEFRVKDGIKSVNSPFWNKPIWVYDNSYYFYFGLNKGNTALSKLKRKYFTECIPEGDVDFYIVADSIVANDATSAPTGAININIIGGIGPYKFTWDPLTVGSTSYPAINTTDNIADLITGTYNVKVVDSNGNVANGSFTVPGPTPISCNVQPTDITTNSAKDGEISVNINGGTKPYHVELLDVTSGSPITLKPKKSLGPDSSTLFSALNGGDYKVIVVDSTLPTPSDCETTVKINEPTALIATLTMKNITCFDRDDGEIVSSVTGGVGPYTYEWSTSTIASYDDVANIYNLEEDTYILEVEDSSSPPIKKTVSKTITNPTEITVDPIEVVNGCNGNKGKITVKNIKGGTSPYTIELKQEDSDINSSTYGKLQSIVKKDNVLASSTTVFASLDNASILQGSEKEPYRVIITDQNTCFEETTEEVFVPVKKLSTTLTPDKNTANNENTFTNTLTNQVTIIKAADEIRTFNVNIEGGIYQGDDTIGLLYKYKIQVQRDTNDGNGFQNFGSLEDVTATSYTFIDNYSSITTAGTYTYKYRVIVYDKNGDPDGCDETGLEKTITIEIYS